MAAASPVFLSDTCQHNRAERCGLLWRLEVQEARRLRFVTPDELLTLTGCVPGAVPPFGNLFGLEVLVDEELTRCEEIACNAGSRAVSIRMRCADFVRLARARVCRFA